MISVTKNLAGLSLKASLPKKGGDKGNSSKILALRLSILKCSFADVGNTSAFGKDALTDKPARFFVTEIIREKILLNYDKEIPYSAEVLVEKFDEKEESIHIMSVIYVERDTQKGIIIGRKGQKLKSIGIEARKEIERFFGKRVFLEIFVQVETDWRNRENKLIGLALMPVGGQELAF